jgi:hypothetical protein
VSLEILSVTNLNGVSIFSPFVGHVVVGHALLYDVSPKTGQFETTGGSRSPEKEKNPEGWPTWVLSLTSRVARWATPGLMVFRHSWLILVREDTDIKIS